MSKEQHGCRYLQRLLASASPKDVQTLLHEILPHTGELMVDPFGNYLVQKVLDVCTPAQRRSVLQCACSAGLPEISCNTHGTRAAQKLVESVRSLLCVPQLRYALLCVDWWRCVLAVFPRRVLQCTPGTATPQQSVLLRLRSIT